MLLNNGDGTLSPLHYFYGINGSLGHKDLISADFNGDNLVDIAACGDTILSILFNNFNSLTPTPLPTLTATFTPTPLPTFEHTFTPTPLPTLAPTLTPTPLPTLTPTLTPTFTTTITPTPFELGVQLLMPSNYFRPGDTCWLKAFVKNPTAQTYRDIPLFVFLDIGTGDYWFWPSWSHYPPDFDFERITLEPGIEEVLIIPEFTFPDGVGKMMNLRFIGGMTDPEINEIFGEIDIWSFGFGE